MSNIDQAECTRLLKALLGQATYPATVTPVKGRLMTANGSATVNGTEVTNSGGSTYAPATVDTALATVTAGATSNTSAITWTNLPTSTLTGLELWDSAGTPLRKLFAGLAANKSVLLGDSLTILTGSLVIGIS